MAEFFKYFTMLTSCVFTAHTKIMNAIYKISMGSYSNSEAICLQKFKLWSVYDLGTPSGLQGARILPDMRTV